MCSRIETFVITSLTKLLVRDDNLGDEGAIILCDALRESTVTKMQELDFSWNSTSALTAPRLWRLWQPS